jgi:hypothetical protein
MKILPPAAFVLAAVIALGAVAQSPSAQPIGVPPLAKPKPSCFWANRIENFAAADEQNLYLRVGVRDVYQAKLFANCFDIDWVHHIALVSRTSSLICEGPNLDVDVIVRDIAAGRQRCPVTSVRKLTPDEVAALPKQARP